MLSRCITEERLQKSIPTQATIPPGEDLSPSTPALIESPQPGLKTVPWIRGSMRSRVFQLFVLGFLVGLGFAFDSAVREAVINGQSPVLLRFAKHLSKWSELLPLLVLLCVPLALSLSRQNQKWQRIICSMMLSGILSGGFATMIRGTTGRTRPCAKVEQGWYGLRHNSHWLVGKFDFNSFPSGHTAAAVGLVAVLLFAKPRVGILALMLGIVVAWDRLYLDVHHFSDVFIGILIGIAGGYITWNYFSVYSLPISIRVFLRRASSQWWAGGGIWTHSLRRGSGPLHRRQ